MNIDEAMMRIQYANQHPDRPGMDSGDKERLLEVCQEFESIFLHMMLKQMRNTVEDGGLIEKSHARTLFEDMHDEELGKSMARGQGVGLAQELYRQLTATHINAQPKWADNEEADHQDPEPEETI